LAMETQNSKISRIFLNSDRLLALHAGVHIKA
jgi:hypothetical protein